MKATDRTTDTAKVTRGISDHAVFPVTQMKAVLYYGIPSATIIANRAITVFDSSQLPITGCDNRFGSSRLLISVCDRRFGSSRLLISVCDRRFDSSPAIWAIISF